MPHDAQPDEGSTARAKTPREVWVILNADGAPQEVYPTEAKARHEAEDWYGQGEHAPIERYMVAPVDVPAGPQRLAAAKTRLDELHAEMTAVLLSIGTTESA